jgi:hypothetical protein
MQNRFPIADSHTPLRAVPRRAIAPADAAGFDAAFANAMNTARAEKVSGTDGELHRVRAGETLYGIAKTRLAAMGQAATPGEIMRHALQIAAANQIRNPDRIQIGQRLDLSRLAASPLTPNEAAGTTERSARPSTAGALHPLPPAASGTTTVDETQADDADALVFEFAPAAASSAASLRDACLQAAPSVAALDAADATSGEPPNGTAAHVAVARYREMARTTPTDPPGELPDVLFKGVVGKALDLMPIEPGTRAGLQQANAVISNSIVGRSLAALTGVGGPVATLAGLVWGLFSAQKIGVMQAGSAKPVEQTSSPNTP